jgi:O-antigen/teichoic acid export membrane protein
MAFDGSPWRGDWRRARAMIGDWRWLEFSGASVLSSASGSADRLLGLRFLSAAAMGSYYVTFEIFSRFWLLPYLMVPIIFARRVGGQDSKDFMRAAWLVTALAGVGFLGLLAGVTVVSPQLIHDVIGRPLGSAIFALATAVVIASFTQLRIAEMQARGATRRVVWVLLFNLAFSIAVFGVAARNYGIEGLMWAWVIKSSVALATTYVGGAHGVDRQPV